MSLLKKLPLFRLFATGLRMGSMVVRLLGLIILARFMVPEEYGKFAFVVVFGAFLGFLLGAEIYTRTIFKISNRPVARWGLFVSRQFNVVARIVLITWLVAIVIWLLSGNSLVLWIVAIASTDILNLENNRLLVIADNHAFASGTLFLRQILWLVASLLLLSNDVFLDPIHAVLGAWVLAGLTSASLSMVRLHNLGLRLRQIHLSIQQMTKLLAASSMMLFSGLAVRGLISLDKIVLGLSDGHGLLAAYAFFATLAFGLVPIMENAVFIYLMPDLVNAATRKDWLQFRRQMYFAAATVSALAGAYALLIMACADIILSWIGQPYYRDNIAVLYLLMGASTLYVLAMVGYYGVYALRRSERLFINNAVALILCHAIYVSLWMQKLPLAMPIAMLAAMVALLIIHFSTFWRVFARERGVI